MGESLKFLTAILSQASKHPASPHLATLLDQTSSLAALPDPQLRAWLRGVLLGYPEGSSAHEPCGNPVQMCIWVEAYAQEEWYVACVCIGCLARCLYVCTCSTNWVWKSRVLFWRPKKVLRKVIILKVNENTN